MEYKGRGFDSLTAVAIENLGTEFWDKVNEDRMVETHMTYFFVVLRASTVPRENVFARFFGQK